MGTFPGFFLFGLVLRSPTPSSLRGLSATEMVNMQRHVPDQMLVPNGTRNWLMQNLFSIMLVLMAARAVYLLLFPSRDQIDLGYEIHRLMRSLKI